LRAGVLVTVKTYPTLSTKYGETVCTAGVRPDGTWVRIYPVPFRRLDEKEQYPKFSWLECRLLRNPKDPRPETYRPVDEAELVPVGHMDTDDGWRERRRLLLETAEVYDTLDVLIARAKANERSLAVFRPTEVLDLVVKEDEREWDRQRLAAMRAQMSQQSLFDDNAWRKTFEVIPKLPYSFGYRFRDAVGRESTLKILDWEIGQLFWNCARAHGEKRALEMVRQKYLDEFAGKDLHFFLGTLEQWHFRAPNPWLIVGVFPIPHQRQLSLL
jgi:hypothetical protein